MKEFRIEEHYTSEELMDMPVGTTIKRDPSLPGDLRLVKVQPEEEFDTLWDWARMGLEYHPSLAGEDADIVLAVRGSAVYPDITVEQYAGEGDDVDFGALNIFKLANSMRGKGAYEPLPEKMLVAAEVFAAELAFRVHTAGDR